MGLKGLCLSPLMIVTEYMTEGNLYDFLAKDQTPLSWSLRMRIARYVIQYTIRVREKRNCSVLIFWFLRLRDIAEGMKFLHNTTPPIIHRDLKSPNVLVSQHSSPRNITVINLFHIPQLVSTSPDAPTVAKASFTTQSIRCKRTMGLIPLCFTE